MAFSIGSRSTQLFSFPNPVRSICSSQINGKTPRKDEQHGKARKMDEEGNKPTRPIHPVQVVNYMKTPKYCASLPGTGGQVLAPAFGFRDRPESDKIDNPKRLLGGGGRSLLVFKVRLKTEKPMHINVPQGAIVKSSRLFSNVITSDSPSVSSRSWIGKPTELTFRERLGLKIVIISRILIQGNRPCPAQKVKANGQGNDFC